MIAKDGTHGITIEDDGWGAVAADGRLSALFTAMVEVAPERGRLLSKLLDQPLASRLTNL